MSGLSSFNAGASGPEIGCAVHGVSGAGINMQVLLSFALKCIGPGLANVCPKHSLLHIHIYIYIFRFLDSQSLTR